MSDNQKIGAFLTLFGVIFTFLGVVLFFDRGLLAIGNIAFLIGITMIIGPTKTRKWLMQKSKRAGTACFLGGILLVLWGWTFFGLIIEIFGFINLFGNFFPIAFAFMRRIPVIGHILNLPGVSQIVDKIIGNSLPV
uniref:Vesicle transport protein n=1 Tax=Arcella intermedia TaxID=1963864 RepID=A0A6B2LR74_9EUKA